MRFGLCTVSAGTESLIRAAPNLRNLQIPFMIGRTQKDEGRRRDSTEGGSQKQITDNG